MWKSCLEEQSTLVGLRYKIRAGANRYSPLVFLVHGRAGTIDVMSPFLRCIPDEATVVAVEAPLADRAEGGYSWWDVTLTDNHREEAEKAAGLLHNALQGILAEEDLNPSQKIAFGFSQGGVVLTTMLHLFPGTLDGLALLASFLFRYEDGPQDFPPVFIAHGTQDITVPLDKAAKGANYLMAAGIDVTFIKDDVGHKVGTTGMRALKEWTAKQLMKQ